MSDTPTRSRMLRFLSAVKRTVRATVLTCRHWRLPQTWAFGVCAVFKDESPHLAEWLDFHRLMGVEHFFLYDDNSSDDFMDVLQPWIDEGRVTLRRARGKKQKDIYNHCLHHGAGRCRWIAFIDLDEFLFSPRATTLPETMKAYESVPAVFVHWILFGSNGHVEPQSRGTLDSYTKSLGLAGSIDDDFDHRRRGPRDQYVTGWARDGKSIIDPRAVIDMGIHRPYAVRYGVVVEENFGTAAGKTPPGTIFSCDILRINHYWSRSIDELTTKVHKGLVNLKNRDSTSLERTLERERLLNQVDDRVIVHVRDALTSAQT